MKILITGAGGFVGQLLAEVLLNANHTVILVDIFEPPVPSKASNKQNATTIKADLAQDASSILTPDLDALERGADGVTEVVVGERFPARIRVSRR